MHKVVSLPFYSQVLTIRTRRMFVRLTSSVNGFLLKTSTSEVRQYPKSMGFLAVVSPFLGSKPFALLL